jgi:hypothetical protein
MVSILTCMSPNAHVVKSWSSAWHLGGGENFKKKRIMGGFRSWGGGGAGIVGLYPFALSLLHFLVMR